MMKSVVALGLLLIALFMVPTVSQAQFEGFGGFHSLPVVTAPTAPGSITDGVGAVRSFVPVNLAMNLRVFDTNGLLMGTAAFVSPAGTFAGRLVVFSMSGALASIPLPPGSYTGTLFTTPLTLVGFTQFLITNLGNLVQMVGNGRGNLFGYAGQQFAVAVIPETGTGITNVFYCDILDRDKAAQHAIGPVPPGTQHVSTMIDSLGNAVIQNFAHQAMLVRLGTAINAGVAAGGSLFMTFNPGGARLTECVHGTRVGTAAEFGVYTTP